MEIKKLGYAPHSSFAQNNLNGRVQTNFGNMPASNQAVLRYAGPIDPRFIVPVPMAYGYVPFDSSMYNQMMPGYILPFNPFVPQMPQGQVPYTNRSTLYPKYAGPDEMDKW